MQPMKRALAFLLLLCLLLPCRASFADEDQGDAPPPEQAVAEASEGKESTARPAQGNETLIRQIRDTYAAAKKRARRRSFKGYCGAYVANQLLILGINTTYLSANGKNTYDAYCKLEYTTGGYHVTAYGAKHYSLEQALSAILKNDSSPRNILVGFQKGTSSAGKKYGHVLFIHGIQGNKVYFSDSSARTVDDVKYKEGEPIVCSLSSFVAQYAKYKLDGVIHFEKKAEGKDQPAQEESVSKTVDTASGSIVNESTAG